MGNGQGREMDSDGRGGEVMGIGKGRGEGMDKGGEAGKLVLLEE